MRKFIFVLLLSTLHSPLFTIAASAAIYTGGSYSGWSYCDGGSLKFRGGSGDGDYSATSVDTAVGYGTATKLVFVTQPTDSKKSAVLVTGPVAQVQDASSNRVWSAANTITMAILNDPSGSATLGGTISKSVSSGNATFSDLTINRGGSGYTLSASASGLTSAGSNAFNVTLYAPNQPTVQNATYSSIDVIPVKNTLEAEDLQYAVYVTPAVGGNNYIQADGSVGASAVWQLLSVWKTITVTGLSSNTTYTFKTKSRDYAVSPTESDWSATNSIATQRAAVETTLKSDYAYNATSDKLDFHVWVERLGVGVITSSGDTVAINVYNSSGTQLNPALITSSSPDAQGVWWLSWASTGLSEDTNYLARISVTYGGNTYTTNMTINITSSKKIAAISTSVGTGLGINVSAIQSSVGTGLGTKVDNISTSVGTGLGTKVDTLQTDVTSVKTAVGAGQETTLYSKVTSILTDTGTNIPATIASELKKGPRSKILNRPTTVNSGDTVTIRYKTDSGKTPTITVYDADNISRASNAAMTEIGTTGVYEYDLKFQSGWGNGDYTILCAESTTNSADSMIINVGTMAGLAAIETKIDALTSSLNTVSTNVSSIKTIVGTASDTSASNTLYGKISGVSSNIDTLVSKWGSYSASAVIGYVDKLEEYLGSPYDASGKQTVFGKIADVYAQTGSIPSISSLVNNTYNEIQKLRDEISLKGKSETAYSMLTSLTDDIAKIKEAVGVLPTEASKAKVEEIAGAIQETRDALKKMTSETQTKELSETETKRAQLLEGMQKQLDEIKKALSETIKATLKEQQEPEVKTWFEKE